MSKTKIENNNLSDNVVTTPNIAPATVTDSDLSSDAENLNLSSPQLASSLDLSSKTLTIPDASLAPFAADSSTQAFNVGLLGFKHAVNEGLTIFNLVDGLVDEFHDNTGVDTSESSNATYDTSADTFNNSTTSMTLISDTFTANATPSKARIAVSYTHLTLPTNSLV